MKKRRLSKKFVLVFFLFLLIFLRNISSNLNEKMFEFLQDKDNRVNSYFAAIDLNNGSSKNTCVYFVAEVLRKNHYKVPKYMDNTREFINFLNKNGWKKNFNYEELKPGDICFTTDSYGNKDGIPTHTYIFMGWVEKDKYDYAYICDNQAKDYQNKIYHIRNISIIDKTNGYTKDAFSFFMKNPRWYSLIVKNAFN